MKNIQSEKSIPICYSTMFALQSLVFKVSTEWSFEVYNYLIKQVTSFKSSLLLIIHLQITQTLQLN
jgi:hypothetical protein